jgi:hypothetical protein
VVDNFDIQKIAHSTPPDQVLDPVRNGVTGVFCSLLGSSSRLSHERDVECTGLVPVLKIRKMFVASSVKCFQTSIWIPNQTGGVKDATTSKIPMAFASAVPKSPPNLNI